MKKVIIFIIVVALVLTFTPALIYAKNGPVEKATGGVTLEPITFSDNDSRQCKFNAHEAKEGGVPKGILIYTRIKPDGTVIIHEVAIDQVEIIGNEAWFSGIASSTMAIRDGQRFYFYVKDDGTPGTDGDMLILHWEGQPSYEFEIVGGNVVVHSYE